MAIKSQLPINGLAIVAICNGGCQGLKIVKEKEPCVWGIGDDGRGGADCVGGCTWIQKS